MFKINFKIIKKHIIYILFLFFIFFVLYFFKIPCLFRFFTKIPCPSCGMTRAFFSLINLNLLDSFYYHPLLVPSLIAAFIAIHERFLNKKFCDIYLKIFVIIFFLVYFVRLITGTIP